MPSAPVTTERPICDPRRALPWLPPALRLTFELELPLLLEALPMGRDPLPGCFWPRWLPFAVLPVSPDPLSAERFDTLEDRLEPLGVLPRTPGRLPPEPPGPLLALPTRVPAKRSLCAVFVVRLADVPAEVFDLLERALAPPPGTARRGVALSLTPW